jgi:hypothetical protein
VNRAPEPIARTWSYSARCSGSESTENASLISLNRASAVASPGFESGWYWRASLRYVFFSSASDTSFDTPSTA